MNIQNPMYYDCTGSEVRALNDRTNAYIKLELIVKINGGGQV